MNYEYYDKYIKYKRKYLKLKGGTKLKINEDEFILYKIQKGGFSGNVWPTISHMWQKYDKLMGIRSTTNKFIDYTILNHNIDMPYAPLVARGGTSAVYDVLDNYEESETVYVLKITEKIGPHLFNNPKILEEYKNFEKYMMQIYTYGTLKINDNAYKYIPNESSYMKDNYEIKETEMKDYIFDITITKFYNLVYTDASNLTNTQKFTFLYNNINMLKFFEENGYFHGDYKIDNIGFDNDINPILIDYDEETLQIFSKSNKYLELDKDDNVINTTFKSSYIPKYIKQNNNIHYSKYNKFSIGGLAELIWALQIKFIKTPIEIPDKLSVKSTRKLISLSDNNLENDLNLNSINYDLIPTYSELLEILDWLKEYILL
jgi:hypothetical protein